MVTTTWTNPSRPTSTSYTNPTRPSSTSYTTRPILSYGDTVAPIITGYWDDTAIWSEAGKFWHDGGDFTGTQWTNPR